MPLALGWDSARHALHPFSGLWAMGEVVVIGSVSAIYWLGHRRDWQGQWLRARTTAELSWYLPLLAPLLDFSASRSAKPNWYLRVFDPGQHLRGADDVAALCARNESLARHAARAGLDGSGSSLDSYARWTIDILAGQKHYHQRIAMQAACAAASSTPRE